MFELVVTLCLMSAPEVCRDVLLPGYEAGAARDCDAARSARPVDIEARFPNLAPRGNSRCAPVGDAAEVSEVEEGAFVFFGQIAEPGPANLGGVSNAGFVIGGQSVAIIDAGGSRQFGERLYRAVRARTDLPISHVILTHMHPDHVFGASVFAEAGAQVVGHAKLARAMADRRDSYLTGFARLIGEAPFIGTDIAAPDIEVADLAAIDLGGRILDLAAWPTAHTGTDLTVFDRHSGLLFTGDLVFHEHTPALDGSVRGWVSVLDQLRASPFRRIVPGHGGPVLDWPAGGADLARYLSVLIADTRAALDRGEPLSAAAENIARSEAGLWALFDLFNARNATVAYTELEWE